ncbi:MAG: 1-acyl-sn-glycerol-3-phosphate acyltransferase [Fimbriimonadaceae bacterium]|nr:1-acyl-sn-glycerol-3-phosphate acyltransferase [Fimbriimonadaceae bacterium]QYK56227.1 MAG: 1-acyl-sn-glycerol-3-phosphate acyltransferase [Fimbriimonadaceae bacterium]
MTKNRQSTRIQLPRENRGWYGFAAWLVRSLLATLGGGIERIGLENVPLEGPTLIAPVHMSFLDPPVIGSLCPRRLRFMAKEELFRPALLNVLIRSLGAFPVRRGHNDSTAVKNALAMLADKQAVLVFPEGARNDGETMLPIQIGLAMMAKRSGAKVVPVGLQGTQKMLPKGAKGPRRTRVTIAFGKPFTYAEVTEGLPDREARARFVEVLGARIAEACALAGNPIKSASSDPPRTESHPVQTQP